MDEMRSRLVFAHGDLTQDARGGDLDIRGELIAAAVGESLILSRMSYSKSNLYV